ncbi:hypothetical protein NESM_000022000 [Novymonas esmeraldas]|uniref:Uncharacterized protein n=1 Tax=Novymonas esmeraldas TaxID=1808958 RepID=A0AAW0F3R7_9TRYP
MSFSAAPSMMTCFGILREEQLGDSVEGTERLTHLFPILEGVDGGSAEYAPENRAIMDMVDSLREAGGPDAVRLHPIRWRGETEASIRAQMTPVLKHYRDQIILMQERTQRRVLECSELNDRVPLLSDYYQSTPPKWRLMAYRAAGARGRGTDSESLLRTPASVISTTSDMRREQQLRETFQRLEDAAERRGSYSGASSAVKGRPGSMQDYGDLESYKMLRNSPSPRAPLGHPEPEHDSESGGGETIDSAAAQGDSERH